MLGGKNMSKTKIYKGIKATTGKIMYAVVISIDCGRNVYGECDSNGDNVDLTNEGYARYFKNGKPMFDRYSNVIMRERERRR